VKILIIEFKTLGIFLTLSYEIDEGDHDREEEVWIGEEWDLRWSYFIISMKQAHELSVKLEQMIDKFGLEYN